MKLGIIRCRRTEELCAGRKDFAAASAQSGAFAELENIEICGFVSCGGCPGTKVADRAVNMVENGAEAIMLTSCISRGRPTGNPVCPNFPSMLKILKEKLPASIKILEYSHN